MISHVTALIAAGLGWAISGSPVSLLLVFLVVAIAQGCRWLGLACSRITTLSVLVLAVTLQFYLYKTDVAGVVYEPLPFLYHLALGLLLASGLFERRDRDVFFWLSFAGSLILLWCTWHAEIFRFAPAAIRILGSVPLVLTVWNEISRPGRLAGWVLTAMILVLSPLLWFGTRQIDDLVQRWEQRDVLPELDYDEENELGPAQKVEPSNSANDGVVELPRQANIVVDEEVRFFVKTDTASDFLALTRRPLYFRTSTVAVFEGNERLVPIEKSEWILDSDDDKTDLITTIGAPGRAKSIEYHVVLRKEDADRIPLLVGTDRVRVSELFHYTEARFQVALDQPEEWGNFSALAALDNMVRPGPLQILRGASQSHLQLPDTELAARIGRLSRSIVSGQSDPADSIRKHIRNRCQYSLRYRNPNDLSPIENLLFDEKQGHCELFAAATLMLLRSQGIPSRIAYGYTGGSMNREELAIAFRGRDIHAWTEVMDRQGQWQVFDTTPIGSGASRMPSATATDSINWSVASLATYQGDLQSGDSRHPLLSLESILPIAAVFLAAGMIVYRARSGRKIAGGQKLAANQKLPEAPFRPEFVEAIFALGQSAGIPRETGVTLREYGSRLLAAGIGYEDLDEIVDYYYRTRYENGHRSVPLEKKYCRQIRKYSKDFDRGSSLL